MQRISKLVKFYVINLASLDQSQGWLVPIINEGICRPAEYVNKSKRRLWTLRIHAERVDNIRGWRWPGQTKDWILIRAWDFETRTSRVNPKVLGSLEPLLIRDTNYSNGQPLHGFHYDFHTTYMYPRNYSL